MFVKPNYAIHNLVEQDAGIICNDPKWEEVYKKVDLNLLKHKQD